MKGSPVPTNPLTPQQRYKQCCDACKEDTKTQREEARCIKQCGYLLDPKKPKGPPLPKYTAPYQNTLEDV